MHVETRFSNDIKLYTGVRRIVEVREQQALGTRANIRSGFRYEVEQIEQVIGALRGESITVVRRQAAECTKAERIVLGLEASNWMKSR